MTLNFTKIDDTKLKIVQTRELALFRDVIPIDHKNTYSGTLIINDPANPAAMTVQWPKSKIEMTLYDFQWKLDQVYSKDI